MPTVSVKMTEKQFARLQRLARARRVPKSQILREAFDRPPTSTSGASAFDLVADLAGTIEGPRDASTNPSYLHDLGAGKKRRRNGR